ncbi:MAG TPA: hypothetical protein V6D43_03855 [Candidatus Sericytochromatia bacterium]
MRSTFIAVSPAYLPILSVIVREARYNIPKTQVIQYLSKQAIAFTNSSGSTGFEIGI